MAIIGVLSWTNSWYFKDLKRAADEHPHVRDLVALSFDRLSAAVGESERIGTDERIELRDLSGLLVRTMPPGTLEQVVFRMNALHRLQRQAVNVVNSARCLEIAIDKYLALAEMQDAGLPVPETRTCQDWRQALDDFQSLGGDVVVKPLFGSEGRGILRVNDEAMAWRVFKTLSQLGHVIHQQEFVTHLGYDIRVLKIGSKLFGMRRMNPGDFRTNVSQGAATERFELTDEMATFAERAAASVGASIVGVDLLPAEDGRLFALEVNAVPGWRALAATLDVDVARLVLDHVISEAR